MRRIAFRFGNIFINLFLLYSNISKCHKSMAVSRCLHRPEKRFLVNGGEVFVCLPRDVNKFLANSASQGSRKGADRCRGLQASSRVNICRTGRGETRRIAGNINKPKIYCRRELRKIHLIAAHHALHRSQSMSSSPMRPKQSSRPRVKVLRVHKRLKRS